MSEMFDVVEVAFADRKVRLMATNKTADQAEGVIRMAVFRRGVENHFFTEAPAGKYRDGDTFESA